MPLEFRGKWRTECLYTRFPLSALLSAGYNLKLKKNLLYGSDSNYYLCLYYFYVIEYAIFVISDTYRFLLKIYIKKLRIM